MCYVSHLRQAEHSRVLTRGYTGRDGHRPIGHTGRAEQGFEQAEKKPQAGGA